MSTDGIHDQQAEAPRLPEGFELPPGFVLPDGVGAIDELPVDYVLEQPVRELPEVALADVHRHTAGVVWQEVGGEVVVYHIGSDTSYVLNPTSALAWQCFDGESTLGEILADIADVFDVELATVEADFVPIVAGWMLDDLVEEVQHG